jgi:hypothetical protein
MLGYTGTGNYTVGASLIPVLKKKYVRKKPRSGAKYS